MYQLDRSSVLQVDDYGCIVAPPAFLSLDDFDDNIERAIRYDYIDKRHYPASTCYSPKCEGCKNANNFIIHPWRGNFNYMGELRNEFRLATEKIIPIANGLKQKGIMDKIEVYKTFDWFTNLDILCKTCGHPRIRMMYCCDDKNQIDINTEIRIILFLYNAIYKCQSSKHPLD